MDAFAGAERAHPTGIAYFDLVASANYAQERGKFADAAAFYRRALELSSDDGDLYLSLGNSLFELKHYQEAVRAYKVARERGFYDADVGAYRIAVCYALLGDEEQALSWLAVAVASRYKDRTVIAQDDRFVSLRSDPHFSQIVGALPSNIDGRVAGWNYDLDFLTSEIHRLNPAYSAALPVDYELRIAALRRAIPSASDQQIAIEITALFASLQQAHSVMFPFGMNKGRIGMVHLQLYQFSDGLYIIDAPKAERDLIGSQVLAIGGKEVNELATAMRPYLSRDNDFFLNLEVPVGLLWTDLIGALGADASGTSLKFVVRKEGVTSSRYLPIDRGPIDPDTIAIKLIPPRNSSARPPLYLSHLDRNFWLNALDRSTIYVQVNQIQDEPKTSLEQFAQRLDAVLKARKPRNVVVDVRLNNGGNYEASLSLLKALFAFEVSRPDARLFVIIGRNTESAAQNFVSTLNQFGGAIFVGEPTGSKPDQIGDDSLVVLPYSGIMGSIARAIHQTNYRDLREWIAPAIPAPLSASDYFGQRDRAVEAIMAFIVSHR